MSGLRGIKYAAIVVLSLLFALLIIPAYLVPTYASTVTDLTVANGSTVCPGTIGGVWEPGNNCLLSTSYTINSGDTLIVDKAVALEIGSGGALTVDGTLNVTQLVVILGGGVLTVASGGIVNNHNGIDVYGVLNNYGTINNDTAEIYIGLYATYAGTLNNYGVINQVSVEGFAEITITDGGVLNEECGGVINNPPPGVIEGEVTQIACPGVPEFSGPSAVWMALIAAMAVPLLIVRKRSLRLPM
jgi:hypothetical protein